MLELISYASGIAANNPACGKGPLYLKKHPHFFDTPVHFGTVIHSDLDVSGLAALSEVTRMNEALAKETQALTKAKTPFCVLGGDHSCGIGTWSGVAAAKKDEGDIGLIWVDAHMDSHTPATSPSQNLHGMPIAHLLGEGHPDLVSLLAFSPKIKPHNIVLIGVRSFESGEAALLKRLGIHIDTMQDVHTHGIDVLLAKALSMVTANTCGFGVSIDLDAFDPKDAPGVGCREPHGILAGPFLTAMQQQIRAHPHFLGLEIAEFNPSRDINDKTATLIGKLIAAVYDVNTAAKE